MVKPDTDYFGELADVRAFIDRIVLRADGCRRKKPLDFLALGPVKGTLLPKEKRRESLQFRYSHFQDGFILPTGNYIQSKWGPTSTKMPDGKIAVCARAGPVLQSDARWAAAGLWEPEALVRAREIEVTFDLRGESEQRLWARIFTAAKWNWRSRGLLWGRADSNYQLRVYEKAQAPRITRFEIIVRRKLLEKLEIRSIHDVYRVKQFPIFDKVRFREIVDASFKTAVDARRSGFGWQQRLMLRLLNSGRVRFQDAAKYFSDYEGIDPETVLTDCTALNERIAAMLARLLW